MVLTKSEFIASMQKEVRILLHLATKIDRARLDYRPTPKQRSTIELLRYLSAMGPNMVRAVRAGGFDRAAWTESMQAAETRDLDQTLDVIAAQADEYATLLADLSDETFRAEIEMFGRKSTVGFFLVNSVLCGYAAYRTQLFLYLKACGREELNTMNLWGGVDPDTSLIATPRHGPPRTPGFRGKPVSSGKPPVRPALGLTDGGPRPASPRPHGLGARQSRRGVLPGSSAHRPAATCHRSADRTSERRSCRTRP